jgi:peptidoglycan/LPS O-acetylase OafA/YrhL
MFALLVVIPIFWIYRIASVLLFDVSQGYVYEALDMRADQLLLGCLLAMVLFQKSASGVLRLLVSRPWAVWATLGALALSSMVAQVTHHAWRYRDLVGFTLDPLLTSILIVQSIAFSQTSARWLNWRWMRTLGSMSYSIYLYQQVTLQPVRQLLKFAPMPVRVIAGIGTCLIVAAGSFYFVEQPFQQLKERIGRRTSPGITVAILPQRAA